MSELERSIFLKYATIFLYSHFLLELIAFSWTLRAMYKAAAKGENDSHT